MDKKRCLIIIDVQNDFISGSVATKQSKALKKDILKRIEIATKNREDLYYTEHISYSEDFSINEIPYCLYGSPGGELDADIIAAINKYNKINNEKLGSLILKSTPGSEKIPCYNFLKYDCVEIIGINHENSLIVNKHLIETFFPKVNVHIPEKYLK